jgi:serine/threonine protein kinase
LDGFTTLRDERYVLMQPIGEGAQGQTFDGIDKREGRAVAIKRFDVRGATSWKDVELAEREARVLKSLSHPMLPKYVDHFEEGGALYLVMEKIEGESLAACRKRGAVLDDGEIVRLLHDASEALDYLHRRAPPVIHRDLKPSNVIKRPDGSFAFVDFGAVRDKLRPKGGSTVVGTFGYMAPEQMQGRALPASDVYAIGATALSMLTGCEPEELPHRGLAIDVRRALQDRAPRRNRGLAEVLERMLDPNPDRRASRIAPLLPRLDGAPSPAADRHREPPSTHYGRRAARHARREARRAARRAQRDAFREARNAWRTTQPGTPWSGHGSRSLPQPARLLFALLFSAAIVSVALATQVVVPIVLQLLSLFFARRSLRMASEAVRSAGVTAIDQLSQSRHWFLNEEGRPVAAPPPAEPAVRVDTSPVTKVRVRGDEAEGSGDGETSGDSEAPLEDDDATQALRGRGR